MELVKVEFYKLWKRKVMIIFLFLVLLINVGVLAYMQNLDTNITPKAYRDFQNQLESIDNSQRFTFVEEYYRQIEGFSILEQLTYLSANQTDNQNMIDSLKSNYPDVEEKYGELYYAKDFKLFTNNLESEVVFIGDIYSDMCLLKQYPMYLQDIQSKGENISKISIFQGQDESSKKNIIKSAKDYLACSNVEITYDSSHGLEAALSFPITDFLIVIVVFMMISILIFEEKEKGLFSIVRPTTKGGLSTIKAKVLVLFISIGVVTSILIISNLIYMSITCGLGDLSRPIQSIASYLQCTYLLSVNEYLIIYIIIKGLVAFFIGLMMLWVSMLSKNKVTALTITLIFIMIQLVCYLFIQPLDPLYLFKYINIISMLKIDTIFQYYYNVDIFGNLVSLQALVFGGLVIGCIILLNLCIITYYRKRNMNASPFTLPKILTTNKVILSLWKQECYKILWLQKGIVFIVIAIIFQCYQFNQTQIYRQREELVMITYMDKLAGPLTTEKEEYIHSEEQRFLDIHKQLEITNHNYEMGLINKWQLDTIQDEFETLLASEPVFQEVLQQYQGILENPQKEFICPYGYQSLFTDESWTILPTIFIIIFALLSLSNVYSYDYHNGVNKIIISTVKGVRRFQYYKILISIVVCIILSTVFYLVGFIKLNNTYGFNNWFSSITSLSNYPHLPELPILIYFMFIYLLKIFAVLVAILFMLAISKRYKSQFVAILMTTIIFLVPLFLAYSNHHFLDSFSLYPLLMSGIYLESSSGIIQLIFSISVYLVVFMLSIWFLLRPLVTASNRLDHLHEILMIKRLVK